MHEASYINSENKVKNEYIYQSLLNTVNIFDGAFAKIVKRFITFKG